MRGGEIVVRIETTLSSPIDAIRERGEMPMPVHSASRWRNEERPSCLSDDLRRSGRSGRGSDSGIAFHRRALRCTRQSRNQSNVCDSACRCGHISTDQERYGRGSSNARRDGYFNQKTTNLVNASRRAGGRVIAVGSTSLRLLESGDAPDGTVAPFEGETDLSISPGYRFKAVDLFLTNFHLPRSTLFVLVSAFSGLNRMQTAYSYAIENEYRFFSYGDCCLIASGECRVTATASVRYDTSHEKRQ